MEFLPSVSTQFILEEMVDSPGNEPNRSRGSHVQSFNESRPAPARNFPTKRPLDAPLHKSLSDPTALTARPSLQTRPELSTTSEQVEELDQGPWTSEALDLFDFWPPGRPKPC